GRRHVSGRGQGRRPERVPPGRAARGRRAPAAALSRDRDAARWRAAGRNRAGAAPPQCLNHRDLRQGRPRRPGAARPALAGRPAVSELRSYLEGYLALRRGLGFRLERPAQILEGFAGYLGQAGAATVTTGNALAWATAPAGADPAWWR